MNELIQRTDNSATIRWKLLTGASVLALTAHAWCATPAKAEDASRPLIWIEAGGQLSRLENAQDMFSAPLMTARPDIFSPSENFEYPSRFSIDREASIAFQPEDSDWIFSASVRYGRSASRRSVHQQTNPEVKYAAVHFGGGTVIVSRPPNAAKFADTDSQNSERHAILDFQAGKDVGLGMFKSDSGTSTISLGVRFAQFRNKSNIALKSDPDWHFNALYYPILISYFGQTSSKFVTGQAYHSNRANLNVSRSFHGIGPSISWSASAPFAGNKEAGELAVDWGVNAALLFGKQRTATHHQSTARYDRWHYSNRVVSTTGTPNSNSSVRSRNVTVPNVGGFAGISYNYADAKLSLGYKADFFFGAIDGGIDTRKNENRGFMGPYASISIGLGD